MSQFPPSKTDFASDFSQSTESPYKVPLLLSLLDHACLENKGHPWESLQCKSIINIWWRSRLVWEKANRHKNKNNPCLVVIDGDLWGKQCLLTGDGPCPVLLRSIRTKKRREEAWGRNGEDFAGSVVDGFSGQGSLTWREKQGWEQENHKAKGQQRGSLKTRK